MNLYEDLMYRRLIKDFSDPELKDKLNNEKLTFYIGTDPTADSMHIGHFSSFLIASRLAKYGHHPILLIGGATGLIGDPKPSKERPMISKEQVLKNVDDLTKQAKEIFGGNITIGENGNWFCNGKDTGIPATPAVDEQLDNINLQLQQHNKILEHQTVINSQLDNKIQTNSQNINKNIAEIDEIKKEIITFVPISNEFINNLFN